MMNSATSIDQAPPVWTLYWREVIVERSGWLPVERTENVSDECNAILNDIKENYWKPFKAETRVTIWTPVMNAESSLQKLGAIVSVLAREVFTLGVYGYWAQRRDAIEGILEKFLQKYFHQSFGLSGPLRYLKGFRELGISTEGAFGSIRCSMAGGEEVDFAELVKCILLDKTLDPYVQQVTAMSVLSKAVILSIWVGACIVVALASYTTFQNSLMVSCFVWTYQVLRPVWIKLFSDALALPDRALTVEEMKHGPFQLEGNDALYLQFFETSNFVSDVSLPYSSTNMLSFFEDLSIEDLSIEDWSRRFIRWIGS